MSVTSAHTFPAPPIRARFALWVATLLLLAALTAAVVWDGVHRATDAPPALVTPSPCVVAPTHACDLYVMDEAGEPDKVVASFGWSGRVWVSTVTPEP